MNRLNRELKTTINRYVYNRLRKQNLERTGKIRCSYCRYHKGENDTCKWYGKISGWRNFDSKVKHPSWKLTSKSQKQWMPKGTKRVDMISRRNGDYFAIKF